MADAGEEGRRKTGLERRLIWTLSVARKPVKLASTHMGMVNRGGRQIGPGVKKLEGGTVRAGRSWIRRTVSFECSSNGVT
jgi:hypothetical protein